MHNDLDIQSTEQSPLSIPAPLSPPPKFQIQSVSKITYNYNIHQII